MTPEPALDPDLIRETISDLDYNLTQLDGEIAAIEAKRAEVAKRRDKWARQLKELDGTGRDTGRQRAPKGENFDKVFAHLDKQHDGTGLTIPEIAAGSSVGQSSVRSVLRQNQDRFECVGHGRWVIRGKWWDNGMLKGTGKEQLSRTN